jgi:hypothetical protein
MIGIQEFAMNLDLTCRATECRKPVRRAVPAIAWLVFVLTAVGNCTSMASVIDVKSFDSTAIATAIQRAQPGDTV